MKPILIVTAVAVLGASIVAVVAGDNAAVVAQMGPVEVTTSDVQPLLQGLDPQQREALSGNPAALDQAVRAILVQRAVYQEALAKKWDQQPDVVAKLQRMRETAITESYLASVCQPPADYPPDADVKAAYEGAKDKLIVPRQFRLAQIFIAQPKNASPAVAAAAAAKLDALRKNLGKSDDDFAAFARASSDDRQSGTRGGEIGWVAESQIQPELRSKVSSMAKGTQSEPIQLSDGWHIIRVLDIKESYTATLEEIRPQLVEQLRSQKAQVLRQAYLQKLVQQNPITVNQIALTQVTPKSDK